MSYTYTHIPDSPLEIDIILLHPGSPEVRYLPNGDPGWPAEPPEVDYHTARFLGIEIAVDPRCLVEALLPLPAESGDPSRANLERARRDLIIARRTKMLAAINSLLETACTAAIEADEWE